MCSRSARCFGATVTVDVTATTVYVERGVSSPMLDNVSPGELVAVFGTVSGTTVTATEVNIWVPRCDHDTPVAAGVVMSAPTNGSFAITSISGARLTVDVTATTNYFERGVSGASLDDVVPGVLVAVFGTTDGTTVTANAVVIAGSLWHGLFGFGRRQHSGHRFGGFGWGRGHPGLGTGCSGASGPSVNGSSGPSGPSGATGPSGSSGPSGAAGPWGPSGASGQGPHGHGHGGHGSCPGRGHGHCRGRHIHRGHGHGAG